MDKKIIFSHSTSSPDGLKRILPKDAGTITWLFLSQDYTEYMQWKKVMPDGAQEIKFKNNLDAIANDLRKPFLHLMANLGANFNSPAWWSSRISERNTLVSPLFLYCCYQEVFSNELNRLSGIICVIVEDWELLESLYQIAFQNNVKVQWFSRRPWIIRKALAWGRGIGRIGKALFGGMKESLAGTDFIPLKDSNKIILIHTYSDSASFGNDGAFHDRYFPGLSSWFENKGHTVVTMPVLFETKFTDRDTWIFLRKSSQKFLNRYYYYHLSDYFFAFKESWRQIFLLKDKIFLCGKDVTELFTAERDRFLFGSIDAILYVRLPLRLRQAGFKISQVIAPFENMIDEKCLIGGLRRYMPQVKIVGFQHSTLWPLLLCQYVDEKVDKNAPLPDRIVCNGEFLKNILIEEGLHPNRLAVGPALRYAYLKMAKREKKQIETDILITVSLIESDALELMSKMNKAFGELGHLKIVIKFHPMMQVDNFLKQGTVLLPKHFQRVDGSIQEHLSKTKILISMSSSTVVEALSVGVPVIVVGRENSIDFNPLVFSPWKEKLYFPPEDIRERAIYLLESKEERQHYEDFGPEYASQVFHPISDEAMAVFKIS